MASIEKIFARQIYDSRGNPTVEVELSTSLGIFRAAVPSGASTGLYEAHELRDGNKSEFLGKGVSKAISNVNTLLGPQLIASKLPVTSQSEIDEFLIRLDGTKEKKNMGANSILGISMAVARAGAAFKNLHLAEYISSLTGGSQGMSLPCPSFNVINGGSHASNVMAFQEFMIMPTGASSFKEALKMGSEIYQNLKALISKRQKATLVGDEGGFAPDFIQSPSEALALIQEAISVSGYTGKVHLALDVAASEFATTPNTSSGSGTTYDLDYKLPQSTDKSHRVLSGSQLLEEYKALKSSFPLLASIEDPFDQDDWESWSSLTQGLPSVQVVGDDLTVTSIERITSAIDKKSCNALLLKINQIGSVSESIRACQLAQANGWGVMVSHRSGETEDTFIADLAVGLGAGQIKAGAPCRSERLAKYNQLLRIEEALGSKAPYTGLPKNFKL